MHIKNIKICNLKVRFSKYVTMLIFLVKVVVIGENHIPNLGASHKKEMDGKDKKLSPGWWWLALSDEDH